MRLPPRSTSTYTHFPYTTLFRSIRRRTARRFPARRHASIEPCRLLCVDQPHGALDQPFGAEERLVGGCDHIDDGIADRKDIQRRIGHWRHSSIKIWKAHCLTGSTVSRHGDLPARSEDRLVGDKCGIHFSSWL